MEDAIRLLDHLKISKAHIVGHSMGSRITCSILGFHPDRLRSAVLGAYGWFPPGDESRAALEKEVAESLEEGKGIMPLIKSLIPAGSPEPAPEQMAMVNKALLAANDPLALAAVMRNSVPSPSEAQLRTDKVPMLSVVGDQDPLKSSIERLNGLVPNLKIVVIPMANHATALYSTEFIKNVKSFLLEHLMAVSETK